MKKFFLVTLIILSMIFVGCGSKKFPNSSVEKNMDESAAILLKDSFWVEDSKNMPYLKDAITRRDTEYLKQLMIEQKVFFVDKDTKISCFGKAVDKNNVRILFKEGRYTNKTGCTHASNVVDEKDFPAYVEAQKQKKFALIQKKFNGH